jgi:glucose/arabinose dehydrogenase
VGALGFVAVASVQDAAARARGVRLVRVGLFRSPDYLASTSADPHAVYVVERSGRVWIVRAGRRVRQPFLDVHADVHIFPGSEQGLMSMAFSPDYSKSGLYYVYYSNRHGDIRLRQFRRSRVDPDRTLQGSGRTILALVHPGHVNHYGGQLQFGSDRHLYVSIGDGGCCGDPHNNAQSLGSLNGKILRIDPNRSGRGGYSIPRNNPFVQRPGARGEIFAYGFRNPFRFSFDAKTGAAWIADVGQDKFEEVDFRGPGKLGGSNFGWSAFEGYSRYTKRGAAGAIAPLLVESHSRGWCAIIGGYVVRDPGLPELAGRYVFGDYCSARVFATRITAGGHAFSTGSTGLRVPGGLTSFGTDAAGHLYATSAAGSVYRFT